jgi:hypothetical protein
MRLILALSFLLTTSDATRADEFGDLGKRVAVDLVLVRGEGELRGVVIGETDGVTIAVQRDWMKSKYPKWLDQIEAAPEVEAGEEKLTERIEAWIRDLEAKPEPNRTLIATISIAKDDLEKQRKKKDDGADEPSRFVLVKVPADQVRRTIVQPPEKKQLAMVAWEDKLANAEGLPAPRLKELVSRTDKNWAARSVDLAKEFPRTQQTEEEWTLRKAIWEFQFGEQVSFQGTGDSVFRTDRADARPALAEIIPSILKSSSIGDLSSLLGNDGGASLTRPNPDAWRQSAIQQAEKAQAHSFRVTRVIQQLEQNQVRVESGLMAKAADGEWKLVWQDVQVENASKANKDAEDQIRRDPQLEQVLQLAQTLGVQGEIDRAIRFGANTMAAQQQIDTRFRTWIESVTKSLDRPTLRSEKR